MPLVAGTGFLVRSYRYRFTGEDAALTALCNATAGPNWRENSLWLRNAPVGSWQGVEIDIYGRGVRLNLSADNLRGTLPPELGNLNKPQILRLSDNHLPGAIPATPGAATALEEADLSGNAPSGAIPVSRHGTLRTLGRAAARLWPTTTSAQGDEGNDCAPQRGSACACWDGKRSSLNGEKDTANLAACAPPT